MIVIAVVFLASIAGNLLGLGGLGLLPIGLGASCVGAIGVWIAGKKTHRVSQFPFQELGDSFVRFSPAWAVITAIAIAVAALVAANILQFEALDGTLWDLSTYIQTVSNGALRSADHRAFMTFTGERAFTDLWHFSVSIPTLVALYRLIPAPELLLAWQCAFAIAPAFVLLFGYRAVYRSRGLEAPAVGYLLLFCCFYMNPIFSGQFAWPYIFHIAGMAFFALAYFFYFQGNWIAWALCLALFTLQKEEFGLYSACFAICAVAFRPKTEKRSLALILSALFVSVLGLGLYSSFTKSHGQAVSFGTRFGNVGHTPSEAARNLFLHPSLYWNAFTRESSLRYATFFAAFFGLLAIARKFGKAFLYFSPCLPFVLIHSVSQTEVMHQLKDHYSLPLNVALLSSLVYGALGSFNREELKERKDLTVLAALLTFFAIWAKPDGARFARHQWQLYQARAQERALMQPLEANPDLLICCQDRLCTKFSDREMMVTTDVCLKGSTLTSEWRQKSAVFVVYSDWKAETALPLVWQAHTPLLKISAPVRLLH